MSSSRRPPTVSAAVRLDFETDAAVVARAGVEGISKARFIARAIEHELGRPVEALALAPTIARTA